MENQDEYAAIIAKAIDAADEQAIDEPEFRDGLKLMAKLLQQRIDDEEESSEPDTPETT